MLYFDHAATSWPKPQAVQKAVIRAMTEQGGNPGRSAHPLSLRAAEVIYRTRETARSFFHAPEPENVLFYPNATYAVNTVLHGLFSSVQNHTPHILYSEQEHNAVLRPLYALTEKGFAVAEAYPVFSDADTTLSDKEILAGIRSRIRQDTALIIACHVSNICSSVLPITDIGRLCGELRIPFLVDASQSAGVWDIDMERDGISYLCTAGHKALLGPQGSGLLILGKNARIPASLCQGGNGVNSLSREMPDFLPEALEAGTLWTPAIAGLGAGMTFLSQIGIRTVRENCFALYARLRDILLHTKNVRLLQGTQTTGTTLSFTVSGRKSEEIAAGLAKYDVCVRAGLHCAPLAHHALGTEDTGTVRVSIGFGNRLSEAEAFYRILYNSISG